MFAVSSLVNPGLSSTILFIFLWSSCCISLTLHWLCLVSICLLNSNCTLHLGSEANRFQNLTLSFLEATSSFCWFVKFVTLPLIVLLFFCWSTLGALETKSEDHFCDCEDALDLVLGCCGGGGGRELCFLGGDEEGGGGVFSFLGTKDGGRGGREGDFYLLEGDGKEPGKVVWSPLLGDGEWSSLGGEDSPSSSSSSEDN